MAREWREGESGRSGVGKSGRRVTMARTEVDLIWCDEEVEISRRERKKTTSPRRLYL